MDLSVHTNSVMKDREIQRPTKIGNTSPVMSEKSSPEKIKEHFQDQFKEMKMGKDKKADDVNMNDLMFIPHFTTDS